MFPRVTHKENLDEDIMDIGRRADRIWYQSAVGRSGVTRILRADDGRGGGVFAADNGKAYASGRAGHQPLCVQRKNI